MRSVSVIPILCVIVSCLMGVCIVNVDANNAEITFNDSYTFKISSTSQIIAVPLTENRFAVAYQDGVYGLNKGLAQTFDIDNNDVNENSEYIFNDTETDYITAKPLSADKFIIAYVNKGNYSYGTLKIATVSEDGSISLGDTYIFSTSGTEFIDIGVISENKFILAFRNGTNGVYYSKAMVGNVDNGGAVSFGAEYIFNPSSSEYISVSVLSSEKIVIAYQDDGDYDFGKAVVGTISGNTISFGSEYDFNCAKTEYISVVAISENMFAVVYRDFGNSLGYGCITVGEVSDLAIQYRDEYTFNTANTFFVSVSKLAGDKIIIAYQDAGGMHYGNAILGEIAGNEITFGDEYTFSPALTGHVDVAEIANGQFVIGYQDKTGGQNYGNVVLGSTPVITEEDETPPEGIDSEPEQEGQGIDVEDGGLIRNPNADGLARFDIYIVKLINDKKFKRLILSPHVFESYNHLRWEDVKDVDQSVMDSYTTSELVRAQGGAEIYRLVPDNDSGSKEWLNMSTIEFRLAGYDQDSVYTINQVDLSAYK